MVEKEEQTPPIDRRAGPGSRRLSSVSRELKRRSNPLDFCGEGNVAISLFQRKILHSLFALVPSLFFIK